MRSHTCSVCLLRCMHHSVPQEVGPAANGANCRWRFPSCRSSRTVRYISQYPDHVSHLLRIFITRCSTTSTSSIEQCISRRYEHPLSLSGCIGRPNTGFRIWRSNLISTGPAYSSSTGTSSVRAGLNNRIPGKSGRCGGSNILGSAIRPGTLGRCGVKWTIHIRDRWKLVVGTQR